MSEQASSRGYDFSQFKLTSRGVFVKGLGDQAEILLCYNIKNATYVLPGGCIERSEGARQTLARELLEEFGVAVEVGEFLFVFEQAFEKGSALVQDYSFVFEFQSVDPNAVFVQVEGHIKPVFVKLSELEVIDFKPKSMIKYVVDSVLKRGSQSFISTI